MRKILLTITITFFLLNACAHSPQVSTISFIQNENKSWSVFITAPLYACQLAIQANYPTIDTDSLVIDSFQRLMISLIKQKLIINGDSNVNLVNAKIQVGHESTMYFEINDSLPINEVDFKVFDKLRDHFTLLKLVPQKANEINCVLNTENNYVYIVQGHFKKEVDLNLNKYLDIIYEIGSRYILIVVSAFLITYILYRRGIFINKKKNS
jgi:hypothetical protein